jgi:carboxypeptidase C (cathepsin A)
MINKILIVAVLGFTTWIAQAEEDSSKEKKADLSIPKIESFVTQHKGIFGTKKISYTATVSNISLKNDKGEVIADAVTTSYIAKNGKRTRPVTFVFNGGPGSSSVWLHMGLLGPKRVLVPSDAGDAGNAPYTLSGNPHSPLDLTDLVFIDPIGTGFSVLAGKGQASDVWGLAEDAKIVSQIVREWIQKNNRWNAPKYIAGESFGTTRAAAMLPFLNSSAGAIRLNGLILISQALDYTGSTPIADNLVAFVTYLPTMAATARYHGKGEHQQKPLETLMTEVRAFASDEYLPALFKGSSLAKDEYEQIAQKLAGYLGLSVNYIKRSNLRVQAGRYLRELLREEGLSVGRLDGRYTSKEVDNIALSPKYDAGSAAISGAYTAGLNDYLNNTLAVNWDRSYKISGREVGKGWVWDRKLSKGGEPMYVNTAPALALAMSKNPALKVLVTNGYYDYATPFFDAEYTFNRHGIDMSRVTMTYYEAGHMMYVHQPSLEKMAADIRLFLNNK